MLVKDYILKFASVDEMVMVASDWFVFEKEDEFDDASPITAVLHMPEHQSASRLYDINAPDDVYGLVTVPDVYVMDEVILPHIVSEAIRGEALPLPTGVIKFQSMIAGVKTS